MKTILYRLSGDGFNPYYQNHHVEGMELGLKHFKENIGMYPEHLRHHIKNGYDEVIPEWKEFTTGIFTFAGSLPDKETIRILTNHLTAKQRQEYVWWTGEIDVNQYAFEGNNLWRSTGFQKIEDLVKRDFFEIFIPEQFLKVSNIQKWSSDYRSIYHITDENLMINGIYKESNEEKKKLKKFR